MHPCDVGSAQIGAMFNMERIIGWFVGFRSLSRSLVPSATSGRTRLYANSIISVKVFVR